MSIGHPVPGVHVVLFHMIQIFHGNNAHTHDAYQAWRRCHPDGFNLTEKSKGKFVAHWTQDKRESPMGRGCHHQGSSGMLFLEDKGGCYTATRKVCSESLPELFEWARLEGVGLETCSHCHTSRFPFPRTSLETE